MPERRLRRPELTTALLLTAIAVAALALRATLINGTNEDVDVFRRWLEALRSGGLDGDLSTYPPAWSYMVIVSDALLGSARDVAVLKAGAILADLVGAAYAYRILRLRHPAGLVPALGFAALLFAPTVALNSAYWGQIDMLWVAPVLACVFYVLRGRPLAAFVAVGIGLAFKQQVVFVVPFLLVLALRRVVPWRWFVIPPLVYLASLVPSVVAGRSLRELVELYWNQTDQFEQLTLNAPSVYAFLPESVSIELHRPAVIWSVAVIGLLTLAAAIVPLDYRSFEATLGLAALSVLATPLLLPKMHERYFLAADVLVLVLAFVVPRLLPLAVALQVVSVATAWPFLFRDELFPLPVLAVVQLAVTVTLAGWLVRIGLQSRPRRG